MYKNFFKRIIDFTIVFIALLIIWPILLIITIWLHFANKGAGAFFTEERPGKDGKIFKVIKFKSMTDERDENGDLLDDDQRLSKVEKFVRKHKLISSSSVNSALKGLLEKDFITMDKNEYYVYDHFFVLLLKFKGIIQ